MSSIPLERRWSAAAKPDMPAPIMITSAVLSLLFDMSVSSLDWLLLQTQTAAKDWRKCGCEMRARMADEWLAVRVTEQIQVSYCWLLISRSFEISLRSSTQLLSFRFTLKRKSIELLTTSIQNKANQIKTYLLQPSIATLSTFFISSFLHFFISSFLDLHPSPLSSSPPSSPVGCCN